MRRIDLWQKEREQAEVLAGGLKVLRGQMGDGRPTVVIFAPKGIKPLANYVFKDEARREAFIAYQVENQLHRQRRVVERRAQRAGRLEGVKLEPVEVGDIFEWSWGWEQTNLDYFQVVERRGRQVVVREIAQETVPGSEGFMSATRLPRKDVFLEGRQAKTLTKLIQYTDDGRAYLAQEFGWCDLWDGKPHYASWYA
jgi:hypothetical protein